MSGDISPPRAPPSRDPPSSLLPVRCGLLLLAACLGGFGPRAASAEDAVGYTIAPDGTIVFDAPSEADPGARGPLPAEAAEAGEAGQSSGASVGEDSEDGEPSDAAVRPEADTAVVDIPASPGNGTAAGTAPATGAADTGSGDEVLDPDGTLIPEAPAGHTAAPPVEEGLAGEDDIDAGAVDLPAGEPGAAATLQEIEVFGARPRLVTPLPGVVIEEGTASSNIQAATGEAIRDSGAVTATQFMNEQLQSVTVRDTTGNPFQQELVFRGFSASPVAATPQGLSVYLDGVRVNEPFGQVVNWDLIPLNAVETLALVPGSNPLFGLNTIGGAVSLTTRSGFSSPGVDVSELAGSWGRNQTQLVAGASDAHVAGLVAINHLREDGWRNDSPSAVNQVFARADGRGGWGQATVQALRVDNELFGAGLIPEEDAARDPRTVYTAPDGVENRLDHFWANLQLDVTDNFSATALAYHRRSDQATSNGDFWDDWIEAGAGRIPACTDATDPADRPDFINGALSTVFPGTLGVSGCIPNGVLNQGLTQQKGHGAALQLLWVTERNQLVLGATWDSDSTFFRQAELLGDIDARRNVVVDPNREYRDGPLVALVESFIAGFGSPEATIDFLRGLGTPDAIEVIPIIESFATNGYLPISTQLTATAEAVLRNRVRGRNESTAAFFYDVFSLTPRLSISFGARWSLTTVQTRTENDLPIPLYQFAPGFRRTFTGECAPEGSSNVNRGDFLTCIDEPAYEYQAFNPAAGFSWQFTDAVGVFGNLSRGSRTPSAIELACANPDEEFLREFLETTGQGLYVGCTIPAALGNDPFLDQVRSTTYEVGGRGSLADLLDWNLTTYQTDNTNDILFVSLGIANRGVFENFGRTRRRGVEMGLSGAAARVNWFFNYAWVEATFQSRARILNLSNSSSAKRSLEDGTLEGEFFVERGDVIPGVPEHALRMGATFAVTPRLTLGLQALGQTASFVRGNENNQHRPGGSDRGQPLTPGEQSIVTKRDLEYVGRGVTRGFAIFNLDASYQFTEGLSAFLQVDNLLDQDFETGGQLGRNAFPSVFPTTPAQGAFDPSGFSNNSNDWTHSTFVGPGAPRAVWFGIRYQL